MNAIEKLIGIADAELGYLEKKTKAQLDDKTANAGSNNYTKYWRDIKPDFQGEPWCACFVTWCFVQAFGKALATKLLKHYPYVYCPTMQSLFTLNANPKRGDIVIFKRNGEFVHTGIVIYVDGDYFMTIEGNTSGGNSIIANGGGVCRKSYYNSNLPGTKFITPDWSLVPDTSTAVKLTDISGHNAEKHIQKLVDYKIVSGYEDGTFRPGMHITRAEYAVMVVKSLENACRYKLTGASNFNDVNGHYAADAIGKITACGIVNGFSDGTFKPDEPITRAQAAMITANFMRYCGIELKETDRPFPDTATNYADRHIQTLKAYGVVNGYDDGTFRPDEQITRAEAAVMLANALTVIGK